MPVATDFLLDSLRGSHEQFVRVCTEYRERGDARPTEKIDPIRGYALEKEYDAALKLLKDRFPDHTKTPTDEKEVDSLFDEIVKKLYLSKK